MNLWEQYCQAVDAHRVATEKRDATIRSWHASIEDKQRAILDAADAASRCVEALQAYRGDLTSGLEIVDDDPEEVSRRGSVVHRNSEALRGKSQHKINRFDKLSDRTDRELDRMCEEFSRGRSVMEIARDWRVSIASVTVMLAERQVLRLSNPVDNREKNTVRISKRKQAVAKRFVTVDSNIQKVAELFKAGHKTRQIARLLNTSDLSIQRARREAIRRGLLSQEAKVASNDVLVGYCVMDLGMSRKEVAELLRIKPQAVRSSLSAYRRRYQDGLTDDQKELANDRLQTLTKEKPASLD